MEQMEATQEKQKIVEINLAEYIKKPAINVAAGRYFSNPQELKLQHQVENSDDAQFSLVGSYRQKMGVMASFTQEDGESPLYLSRLGSVSQDPGFRITQLVDISRAIMDAVVQLRQEGSFKTDEVALHDALGQNTDKQGLRRFMKQEDLLELVAILSRKLKATV